MNYQIYPFPMAALFLRSTRFRWQQRPVTESEAITDFGLRDVYIGPGCENLCGGHGNCQMTLTPVCECDHGYQGNNCSPWNTQNPVNVCFFLNFVMGDHSFLTAELSRINLIPNNCVQEISI